MVRKRSAKITAVYIHVPMDTAHQRYACRFVDTYRRHPPGIDHKLIVVCNGSPPNPRTKTIFKDVDLEFFQHDDSGWDIGAYQAVCMRHTADMMAFFGGSCWFTREGWLKRMWEAQENHGLAIYGSMGNRGDARFNVFAHVRSTGFWCRSDLMNEYPLRVTHNKDRYQFEHGKNSFCGWALSNGINTWVVTWGGEYAWKDWDNIPNGFHRGDQSGLLVRDRLTDPPYYQDETNRNILPLPVPSGESAQP